MQVARLILLVVSLFVLMGMGWWKWEKPLPVPDAPEITIGMVVCDED